MWKSLLGPSESEIAIIALGPWLGEDEFRPTRFFKEAVPDHGEQAHIMKMISEKPEVVTNCVHLANAGRNLKPAKVLYSFSSPLQAYFIDSRA